jgi:ATP-dependent RNA helicase DeaD
MAQNKRNKVLGEFTSEKGTNVLVCTDVAARGLDVPGVTHVYNYDLPTNSSDYIHRIGRTARAGKEGIVINVLCSRDYENFNNVLQDKKIKVEAVRAPYVQRVNIVTSEKGRGKGGRQGRGHFARQRSQRNSRHSNSRHGGPARRRK